MPTSTPPHPVLDRYYRREGDRDTFVASLFDGAAKHYERVGHALAFGSGSHYRRSALHRAGLRPGMRLLDVATGTGQVARAAVRIIGDPAAVVGLDPSAGMLRQAQKSRSGLLVRARAEEMPLRDDTFDMLTMGFALRHVATLETAFAEYRRVLRPGGRILLLEVSRPRSSVTRWIVSTYVRRVLPRLIRLATRNPHAPLLMEYYWDTIAECVPHDTIIDALRRTGFVDVRHHMIGGCLSEYVGRKPGRGETSP